MAKKKYSGASLGIFLNDGTVEAALVRKDGDDLIFVNKFVRKRKRQGERISDLAAVVPGLRDSSEADFTLEIGDGAGSTSSDLFLSSEFEGLDKSGGTKEAKKKASGPVGGLVLDILKECADLGYANPKISFCVSGTEVDLLEVKTAAETAAKKNSNGVKVSHSLKPFTQGELKQLKKKIKDSDKQSKWEKGSFFRLVSDATQLRSLVVAPIEEDPVKAALEHFTKRHRGTPIVCDIVDAEITNLSTLIGRSSRKPLGKKQAVVRVGADDTLILFYRDGVLDKYDRLRSLTSYDPVDTVCSRVLLKQDEYKIDHLDEVYVLNEHVSMEPYEVYRGFFKDSEVIPLLDLFDGHIKNLNELHGNTAVRTTTIPALGVAVRQLNNWDAKDKASLVNLLPKKLRGVRRKESAFAWHTVAMLGILFIVALWYSWRYMEGREQVSQLQEQLALNPPPFPDQDPLVLRAKVDSVNARYNAFARSLAVMDSLLVGSDKWTRALEKISTSTRQIGRIWIKGISPENGEMLRIEGNALARANVASLAQQWNGSIEKLNFADIEGVRVYSFMIMAHYPGEMPKVAEYLVQQSREEGVGPELQEALAKGPNDPLHDHK